MAQSIGLFGGSFNPIHCGHLIVARAVAEQLALDSVIFLPSANPPHKEGEALLDARHRAEMVKRAIAEEPVFDFSEFDLLRDGPSYTIDTVNHFRAVLGGDVGLYWIIGTDSLVELSAWHRVSDLVNACQIVTAARTGWDRRNLSDLSPTLDPRHRQRLLANVLGTPVIEISSTDIRRRIQEARSIRFLVPGVVRRYIEEHGLYRR